MRIRWPWTRRCELIEQRDRLQQELLTALSENVRLSREWGEAHQANADLLHKLDVMRSYFDRLVVLEPLVRGKSGKAVTIAIPDPVVTELKKGGSHLIEEFAREIGRRLVLRALRELFDNPVKLLTIHPRE